VGVIRMSSQMRLVVPFSSRVSITSSTVSSPRSAISSMLFSYLSSQSTR
jgi:hypothetical protein